MAGLTIAYFCLLVAGMAYIVHLLWGRRIMGYGATGISFFSLVALSAGLKPRAERAKPLWGSR